MSIIDDAAISCEQPLNTPITDENMIKSESRDGQDLTANGKPSFAGITINGDMVVTGLIDPSGLEFDPVAANPGGVPAYTLWIDNTVTPVANLLKKDTSVVILGSATATTDNTLVRWDGTDGNKIQSSAITISDTTAIANFLPTTGLLDLQCDSTRSIFMSTTANGSVRIGRYALSGISYSADSLYNIAIGESTLTGLVSGSTNKTGNIAIGRGAFAGDSSSYTIAIGTGALEATTTGGDSSGNVGIGHLSGPALEYGTYNIFLGESSGLNLTTASSCVAIGYNAGRATSSSGTQIISIGYNAQTDTNYCCQIGESGVASQSGIMKFRSQEVCKESWRDAAIKLAYIDGTGNFVKSTFTADGSGNLTIPGKLTVTGLIDPTGLELTPVAANPGGTAANTIWNYTGSILMVSANNVMQIDTTAVTDNAVPRFNGTSSHLLQRSTVTISDGDVVSATGFTVPSYSLQQPITLPEPSTNNYLSMGFSYCWFGFSKTAGGVGYADIDHKENVKITINSDGTVATDNYFIIKSEDRLDGSGTELFKIKQNTVNGSEASGTIILDEDTMTSNSATKLCTQQSIKAYVDNKNPITSGTYHYSWAGAVDYNANGDYIYYEKQGSRVTLRFGSLNQTTGAVSSLNMVEYHSATTFYLGTTHRPSVTQYIPVTVIISANRVAGGIIIYTTGAISIEKDGTGNFPTGTPIQVPYFSITYLIT